MPVDPTAARNQPTPLVGHDVVATDPALVSALAAYDARHLVDELADLGRLAGSAEAREHAWLANRYPPELATYDRYGNRLDEVRFHPSWHWLMTRATAFGLGPRPG